MNSLRAETCVSGTQVEKVALQSVGWINDEGRRERGDDGRMEGGMGGFGCPVLLS